MLHTSPSISGLQISSDYGNLRKSNIRDEAARQHERREDRLIAIGLMICLLAQALVLVTRMMMHP